MLRKPWLSLILLSIAISGCAQQSDSAAGMPWWGWVIIIVVIFVLFWLVFRSRPEEEVKAPPAETPSRASETPVEAAAEPQKPDDLTLIEGIGPKINAILQAAEVHTFAQLAALKPERITEILTAGGIRLADPASWPEQARLAAAGEMQRLKAYQDTLKGGRVV